MSQENVELVRRLLDMFARRDHEGVFEFYDLDIEWDATAWKSTAVDTGVGGTAGLAGVYRGHEGVRTYWRRWLEPWKDLEFELEHVLDAGDEVVALIRNQRQVGRHSGIVIEMPPYGGRGSRGPRNRRAAGVGRSVPARPIPAVLRV